MLGHDLRAEFEKLPREWSEAVLSSEAAAIGRFMADDWGDRRPSRIRDLAVEMARDSFLSIRIRAYVVVENSDAGKRGHSAIIAASVK